MNSYKIIVVGLIIFFAVDLATAAPSSNCPQTNYMAQVGMPLDRFNDRGASARKKRVPMHLYNATTNAFIKIYRAKKLPCWNSKFVSWGGTVPKPGKTRLLQKFYGKLAEDDIVYVDSVVQEMEPDPKIVIYWPPGQEKDGGTYIVEQMIYDRQNGSSMTFIFEINPSEGSLQDMYRVFEDRILNNILEVSGMVFSSQGE